ncbi:unnamed protein product [Ectocarpus sp. 12 AP-2014]
MFKSHPPGIRTSIKAGKRYRVQTVFVDGTVLLEEYDAVTQHLECRRWRSTKPFGGVTEWQYEIGDPMPTKEPSGMGTADALQPSSLNPCFHPRDTSKSWEWHIRNLPYPEETYRLSVDEEKQTLVLRTTNKKYFKVFQVPSLIRAGLALRRASAKMSHNGGSTLIISYEKPQSIIDREREARASAVREESGGGGGGSSSSTDAFLAKKGGGVVGAKGTAEVAPAAGGANGAPPECSQS